MLRRIQLNAKERDAMRAAGRFNEQVMAKLAPEVIAGRTTAAVDKIAHDLIVQEGHQPPMLNYNGFPASCCISINSVVVHGIPSTEVISPGDLVKVAVATCVDGWHASSARTFVMEGATREAVQLADCAERCLDAAIAVARPGCQVSDIGYAIFDLAHQHGYSVVREYVGHGIGRQMHQDPSIPGYPTKQGAKIRLLPGTCFCIEPILTAGERYTALDNTDNWTVRTRDGSLAAEAKATILMTTTGPEVLTDLSKLREDELCLEDPNRDLEPGGMRVEIHSGDPGSDAERKPAAQRRPRSWWWPFGRGTK